MSTRVARVSKSKTGRVASKPEEVKLASSTSPAGLPLSVEEIRLRAYQNWETAGKPPGDGVQFWLEAEHMLLPGK